VQRATSVNLRQTCSSAVFFANIQTTGQKSPGAEAETASLKRQDPLLSPCKRLTHGQLAIATVMCANGETTHQLNGAYSCTDVLFPLFRFLLAELQCVVQPRLLGGIMPRFCSISLVLQGLLWIHSTELLASCIAVGLW